MNDLEVAGDCDEPMGKPLRARRLNSHFPEGKFWGQCEEKGTQEMDFFKLAFETIIVGLLTFLWQGATIQLLFPKFIRSIFPLLQKRNACCRH